MIGAFPILTACGLLVLGLLPSLPAAEIKAGWQAEWEKTVAAAWKEGQGLSTGGGSMSLIKGAPHPNAAKVFINWFLSRRGQIALQSSKDLYGQPPPGSRRMDIPKDMLAPEDRLIEGKTYFDVSRSEYADMTPIFKLAKEIMKGIEPK